MQCIVRVKEISLGNIDNSELYGESQDRSELRPLVSGGLTLKVADGHYKLTNAAGNVLRQGQSDGSPQSVFDIYDSTQIPIDDDLTVETPDFSGTFEALEIAEGHGRVDRITKRRHLVYTERTAEGDPEAFGIVEQQSGKTKAIHSIYYPSHLSNKDRVNFVADYLRGLLKPTEMATVTGVNFSRDRLDFKYHDTVKFYGAAYSDKFEESRLLYLHALERQESVSEVFEKSVKYTPEGLFEEKESD